MGTEMNKEKFILTRWRSTLVLNTEYFMLKKIAGFFFNENYNYIIFHLLARNVNVNHIPLLKDSLFVR